MKVRKSLSKAFPRACSSCCSWSSRSMPGISFPGEPWAWCPLTAGTDCLRSLSQRCICSISPFCEMSIRWASGGSAVPPVRFGTSAVIRSACAWCWIMPCMNVTSALTKVGGSSFESSSAESVLLG